MAEERNYLGFEELIEKSKLDDDDIIVIQDKENTKRISFREFRDSLISDNELPSTHRMYSSFKLNNAIEVFQTQLNRGISGIEGEVENIKEKYASLIDVDAKINSFATTVPELAETEEIKKSLESKRDKNIPITCNDIESGQDIDKIQVRNLSKEVLSMMAGNTPVNIPGVPDGGWVTEDIANESINGNKLSKQYRYRGHYPEGNVNNFIKDGIYLIGASVSGVPKYDPDEEDLNRLFEVYNYGPNQYIIQRIYYCEDNTEFIRPYYERKALLNKLHLTDFVAKYDITSEYKITNNILHDNFLDGGVISTGDVHDLKFDRDYYVKKTVKNLPNDKYDFTVSVRKYDTRIEYTAKAINHDSCEIYVSNSYLTSSNVRYYTPWWQTNTVTKSRLQGKRVHLFGDGICYGLGSTDIPKLSYPALLTSKYGITIYNHALGDATVGVYGDDYLEERSVIKQIENAEISNGDIAIIFAGSNDYKSGIAKIGETEDNNDYTFKGAVNKCIELLMTKNPLIKILIITPLFRARLNADDLRNSDDTLINEMTLRDYSNAIKDVCDYNHIPCLDLHSTGMINRYNFTSYLKDRLYPNDITHDMLCDKIFSALNYYY